MSKFNPEEHMMDLKGKKYLQVAWRIVWFREDKPNWGIEVEAHTINENVAVFKATIKDEQGRVISTGFGSETPKDFKDYIEKAETKAIGRALAMLGYGTQFEPELDEGTRIVDSPISRKQDHLKEMLQQIADLAKIKKIDIKAELPKLTGKTKSSECNEEDCNRVLEFLKGA